MRLCDRDRKVFAKPEYVRTIDVAWDMVDERPKQSEDFINKITATANPITIKFHDKDRRRMVYIAARWLNTTAKPGPWSDFKRTFVP